MKRLQAVVEVRLSDGAEAARLLLQFTDGSQEAIEVVRDDMRQLLGSFMAICKAFGDRVPNKRLLIKTTPAEAVLIPTEELEARAADRGGLWLMFRVGSHDLAVALPDPRAAKALAEALLRPGK